MADNLLALYEEREKDFSKLRTRMKKDKKQYELEPYYLKNFNGKKLPKVVSTTLNDPRTFGKRAVAILSSADPQIVVESDNLKTDIESSVEKYLDAIEVEGDIRLGNQVKSSAFPYFCEQSCLRGWIVGASFLREKDGKLVVDRRPLEAMDIVFDSDLDGLVWAGYKVARSAAKIEAEYGKKITNKYGNVTVIYSRDKEEVYVDRKKIREQGHPYKWNGEGYVPFVIKPVNYAGELEHQGESIYDMDRDLYDKMNEMASVLENLTMASYFNAMQYQSEMGEQGEPPDVNPYELGQVASVERGGGFFSMPIADIRNATRLLYSIYENRIQRGSLPNIDYGNLTFPLSAVAITRLTESKDMIFLPRLQALAKFYQEWDMMAIKQHLQIGRELQIGEGDNRKSFKPSELEGKYTIKRQYFSISPDQDIANTSIAQTQMAIGLPQEYIIRHTMKLKDPDAIMDQINYQKSKQYNPILELIEQVHSLIDMEEPVKAEIILQQVEEMYRQKTTGQFIAQAKNEGQQAIQGGQLLPLMEGGGGGKPPKGEQDRVEDQMNEEETLSRLAETARAGRRNQE
jgi:hypothetical protein